VWHFVSSLDDLPDDYLPPQGLSAPQLVQLLINFNMCWAQVFANGRDYPNIPDAHQSPVPWCSFFYGGLVKAIKHLLLSEIIAVWDKHTRGSSGQGLRLTTGFLHYIGLLIRLFEDWLELAE